MEGSLHRFRITRSEKSSRERRTSSDPHNTSSPPASASASATPRQQQIAREKTVSQTATAVRSPFLLACQRCRQVKRRCSKTPPECSLCAKAGLRCSFSEESTVPISFETVKKLQARIAWLSACVDSALPPTVPSVELLETGSSIPRLPSISTEGAPEATSSVEGSEHGPPTSVAPDGSHVVGGDYAMPDAPAEVRAEGPFSSLNESLHSSNTATVNANRGPASVVSNHDSSIVVYAQSTSPSSPAELRSPTVQAVPKNLGRQLVNAYFRHIHRAYPFINRLEILRDMESVQDFPGGVESISTKLYMVMAIGCTTLRRMGQVSEIVSAKFQLSHQGVLQDCLSANDVVSVEKLLLLGLHSLFDPTGISPWLISGLLSRKIVAMGLSRKVSANRALTLIEIEMRHRLFWSVYTFDRMVSVSMGLPFGVSDLDTNVPLPGITLEEYAFSDRAYYTLALQVNRHIITLRQMEEQIMQRVHLASSVKSSTLSPSDRRAIVDDLRNQIENWYTQGCLVTPMERDQIPFHNTIPWLNCRYQNLLLLLYTPSHFNSAISYDHLQELQRAATKYIQLSAVLFQQRHLPLNWITLWRFVSLTSTFFYCLVRSENRDQNQKEEALLCAEVLDAFNEKWEFAKRAAIVFRQLASLADSSSASAPDLGAGESRQMTGFNELGMEVRSLIEDMSGCSSVYCRAVDAAMEILTQRDNEQMLGAWTSRGGVANQVLWDGSALWGEVGELSMDFV